MDRQLDLFGNETEEVSSKPSKTTKRNEAKYIFKQLNGVDEQHYCKDCIHCIKVQLNLKCKLIDTSNNQDTNIYSNEKACKAFRGKK